ncbi:MAG TPA: dehydratase, partial [Erythrobacter sp.]|nr:dehydratase [Erythrobacter sp.]
VTETDNLLFTTMTHNPQPLHLDAEAAKASEFGQILVNGTFTFSL